MLMKPEAIAEVWSMLDREGLAEVARRGPPPVFATISGAHLYGFASRDSDVDLRGAFLLPARDLLGLAEPEETVTIVDQSRWDLDWVAHDLRKLARMLVSHNGYALEQVFSPLVVLSTPIFEELRELARGCVTRPTVRHYQGFARGRRKRVREPDATVKHLLYAFRVFMSGIHLMRTGEVVANVDVLDDVFRLASVRELAQRKREGEEKGKLDPAELPRWEKDLDALEKELVRAHEASALPDEPTTRAAIDDLVVRARLGDRA